MCHVPGAANERITVAFGAVHDRDEPNSALRLLESIKLPAGTQAVTYDMAMRGVHLKRLMELGFPAVVRVARDQSGKPRSINLGQHRIAGTDDSVVVWALDGAAIAIWKDINGDDVVVRLHPKKQERRSRRDGSCRWYGVFEIPHHAVVPPRHRGGTVRIRLDQDARTADAVRFFNEHDGRFRLLHGFRQSTESENHRFKETLPNGRAHTVGLARQSLDMLGYYMMCNQKARIAHERRQGRDPTPFATAPYRDAAEPAAA
jgi:hypothetical protein